MGVQLSDMNGYNVRKTFSNESQLARHGVIRSELATGIDADDGYACTSCTPAPSLP